MSESYLKNVVEAALLAAGKPLPLAELAAAVRGGGAPRHARSCARRSRRSRRSTPARGIELKETAGGFRIQVRRELAAEISRLWPERPPRVTRARCSRRSRSSPTASRSRAPRSRRCAAWPSIPNIIRTVLERNWVRVVGHRDVPGRPELLGTTREFLDYFGLQEPR